MKPKVFAILCFTCLLAAGTAQAQQSEAPSVLSPPPDIGELHKSKHPKGVKAAAAKKKTAAQKSAAVHLPVNPTGFPCPRAQWKDDPVCADAPDEHTLPTPSSHNAAPLAGGGPPKVAVPGVDHLTVSPDIQANNNPRLPGYDSTPMLDSVKKNLPDGAEASPGSRMGLGLGFQF